ncbi:MAG: tail fiber domain-containing protein [bacterium]
MKRVAYLSVLLLLLAAQFSRGQIPQTISYQGVLTDAEGNPVVDGDYTLTFKLYETATDGTPLWTEQQTVTVSNGLFNAILGKTALLDRPFDRPYWLEIAVNGGDPLEPRIEMTASAYSFNARAVTGDSNVFPTNGNVGIGTAQPQSKLHIMDETLNMGLKIQPVSDGVSLGVDNEILHLLAGRTIVSGEMSVDELYVRRELDVGNGIIANGGIRSAQGGFVFPDGTIQTTAAAGAGGDGHSLDAADGDPIDVVFVDNDGDVTIEGSVGIGLDIFNRPQHRLHVFKGNVAMAPDKNSIAVFEHNAQAFLSIMTPDDKEKGILFGQNSHNAAGGVIFNNSATPNGLQFRTLKNLTRMVIDSTGNVGIGTVTPDEKLSVTGMIESTTGGFKFPDGTIQTTASTGGAGDGHSLDAADGDPKDVVFVTADGNVKIGLGSDAKLGVAADANVAGFFVNSDPNTFESAVNAWTHGAGSGLFAATWGTGNALRANHLGSSGNIAVFQKVNADKVVIDLEGNVGIGTTSPNAPLTVGVVGGTTWSSNIQLLRQGTSLDARIALASDGLLFRNFSASTTAFSFRNSDDFHLLEILANGNVGIGTYPTNIFTIQQNSATDPIADAWTTYSSRRWKTNIKTLNNPLDKVQRLRGVSFDWKADGKHDIGLIAEEVGEVIPEVVEYEENGIDAKSVAYARLVAVLIEAVKEQQKRIEKQQAAIANLSKRIAALEGSKPLARK